MINASLPRNRQARRGGVAQAAADPIDGECVGPLRGCRQRLHRERRGGHGRVGSERDGGPQRLTAES